MFNYQLPENWKWVMIDEVQSSEKRSTITGPFGSSIGKKFFVDEGVPVIRGNNLKLGSEKFVDDGFVFITKDKAAELKGYKAFPGDILFTAAGTIGQVGLIPDNCKYEYYIISNKQMRARFDQSKVNAEFAYYWFSSKPMVAHIKAMNTGSTIPLINLGILRKLPMPLPPIADQIIIKKHLADIDNKISINTQTNQTLEAMAQAMFKSWFVDFDPVKAKMRGEQPVGMEAETAILFPEKLVESELGLIPEGWEVKPISALINLIGGGTPKRTEEAYWNGDIPWFSIKDVANSSSDIFVIDTNEKITELGLNKSSTKLLPTGTTIITARGTVGKIALVATPMCMNQSCYGVQGADGLGQYFNYFNLNQAVSTLQQNTHGAVFDTITTKTFETYETAFSGNKLANEYDRSVSPLLKRIELNVRENKSLQQLRDTLLPKLLSGELSL
jgi:type I restriction enzyme S subunit